jgi:hypothetical protein
MTEQILIDAGFTFHAEEEPLQEFYLYETEAKSFLIEEAARGVWEVHTVTPESRDWEPLGRFTSAADALAITGL